MAKATGARDGPGRCLRLLASHRQPCGLSRHYGEDQVLETGIRNRNGQFDDKRQMSPTGGFRQIAALSPIQWIGFPPTQPDPKYTARSSGRDARRRRF